MLRRFVSGLVSFVFKLIYPIEIVGREEIPADENLLLISNHGHLLDPFLVHIAFRWHFFAIGKMELFRNPLLAKFFRAIDAFPVDRDQYDLRAIKTSIAKLKESSLLVFPEGTRNGSIIPLEGKSGAIMMASQAKVRILPITLIGNFKPFRPLKAIIHPVVSVEDYGYERLNSQAYKAIVNDLLDTIYQSLREEINGNSLR